MGYVATNPPVCLIMGGITGPNLWYYASADTAATVDTSGYFPSQKADASGSGGTPMGIKDGDLMMVKVTGTKVVTMHIVNVSAAGVVDLNDGVAITSTTNTD